MNCVWNEVDSFLHFCGIDRRSAGFAFLTRWPFPLKSCSNLLLEISRRSVAHGDCWFRSMTTVAPGRLEYKMP